EVDLIEIQVAQGRPDPFRQNEMTYRKECRQRCWVIGCHSVLDFNSGPNCADCISPRSYDLAHFCRIAAVDQCAVTVRDKRITAREIWNTAPEWRSQDRIAGVQHVGKSGTHSNRIIRARHTVRLDVQDELHWGTYEIAAAEAIGCGTHSADEICGHEDGDLRI